MAGNVAFSSDLRDHLDEPAQHVASAPPRPSSRSSASPAWSRCSSACCRSAKASAPCSTSPGQTTSRSSCAAAPPTRWAARSLKTQTRIIADAKDIARDADGAIASPELYVIVDVPLKRTGTAANVPLRGVGPQAPKLRQNFRIVEGRNFTPGTFESHRRPRREPAVRRAHRRQPAALGHDRLDGRRHLRGPRQRRRIGDLDRRNGAAGRLQPRHRLPIDAREADERRRVPVVQGHADDRPAPQRPRIHREGVLRAAVADAA